MNQNTTPPLPSLSLDLIGFGPILALNAHSVGMASQTMSVCMFHANLITPFQFCVKSILLEN